ncbi:MAG TPA: ABC transporter permease [Bacteroidales bacterium]|nr:ABC transporter permease [Bacteroidales bacterium]
MLRYVLRRLAYGILVLWGVATLVFVLFNLLPGDPAAMMVGQRTDQATVEAVRRDLGLHLPKHQQYFLFLNDLSPISFHSIHNESFAFRKDRYGEPIFRTQVSALEIVVKKPYLRQSYQSRRPVTEVITSAFPNTLVLAVASIVLASLIGILLGAWTGMADKNWLNRIVLVINTIGMSLPSFFAAMLMAWVFAWLLGEYTGLNLVGSLYEVDDAGTGERIVWKNLILPAITLGIRPLAIVTELTRTSLLEVMQSDYIRTARAKGLDGWLLLFRHALRNALNPVVTAISGWFASLLAGAVFVEYIFDWKGLGMVIVDALEKYDLPVLMGSVLFVALLLILINIFVDIIYAMLDPRVRLN